MVAFNNDLIIRYLNRWREGGRIRGSFQGLRDLEGRDQRGNTGLHITVKMVVWLPAFLRL